MASNRIDMQLTSNATSFARGMQQAVRGIRGLGGASRQVSAQLREMDRSMLRTSRIASQARGLFAGFVTVQGLRRVAQFTQNLTAMSSALVEQAAAVGTTSDRLEVFQRVLRGEGATTQQINQGLVQLTRNIGLAANETGPALAVFERFGISIRDTSGNIRGSLEVYADLVDALQAVGPQARAAALGLAIGEEAARTFAASAAQGGDALRAAFRRERGFGVATDEQNQSLKDLEDTMRTLVDSVNTLGRVLLSRFAGSLDELVSRAREMVAGLIGIEQTTMGVSDAIIEVVRRLREFFNSFGSIFRLIGAITIANRLSDAFGGLGQTLGLAAGAAGRLAGGLTNLINRGGRVSSFFGRFSGAQTAGFIDAVGGAAGAGGIGALFRVGAIGAVFAGLGRIQNAFVSLFDPLRELANLNRGVDLTFDDLAASLQTLSETFADAGANAPQVATRFEDAFRRIQASARLQQVLEAPPLLRPAGSPLIAFSEDQLRAGRERLTDAARELNRLILQAMFSPAAVPEEAQRFSRAVARGIATHGEFERLIPAAFRELREIQPFTVPIEPIPTETVDSIREVGMELNRAAEFGAAAGSSIASGFADAVLEIDNAGDALKALGRTLIQLAAQVFVGGPLSSFLSGLFSRAHIGAAVLGGQLVQPLSGEAFVAPTAGRVLSRSEVGRLGASGGETINVEVNIAAGVDPAEIQSVAYNAVRAGLAEAAAGRRIR